MTTTAAEIIAPATEARQTLAQIDAVTSIIRRACEGADWIISTPADSDLPLTEQDYLIIAARAENAQRALAALADAATAWGNLAALARGRAATLEDQLDTDPDTTALVADAVATALGGWHTDYTGQPLDNASLASACPRNCPAPPADLEAQSSDPAHSAACDCPPGCVCNSRYPGGALYHAGAAC